MKGTRVTLILETERLAVRCWSMDDLDAAFAMHGDPEVTSTILSHMRHTSFEESLRHLE